MLPSIMSDNSSAVADIEGINIDFLCHQHAGRRGALDARDESGGTDQHESLDDL